MNIITSEIEKGIAGIILNSPRSGAVHPNLLGLIYGWQAV